MPQVCGLASANRPSAIPSIVDTYLKQLKGTDERKKWVMMAQNALLKASFVIGMPKTINAMQKLVSVVDNETKSTLPTTPRATPPDYQAHGEAMFKKVYDKVTDRVKHNIGQSSPDLLNVILEDVYGKIMSNTELLGELETELVIITVLCPLKVPAQLKGHLYGAKNVGATDHQVAAAKAIGDAISNL
ncbi:hypothetical protein INT43_004980 [Umbelopsis isabellina]|uniref:Carboxymuconolactone decarboxylase-like domain-containing protein n=1 Tax=Mortierella isabellina TaxID=91625 RepID=A0A8H7PEJ3_MORIS|nr:hypothetical protein INT43_004980 [Umbelopsis isabellina]